MSPLAAALSIARLFCTSWLFRSLYARPAPRSLSNLLVCTIPAIAPVNRARMALHTAFPSIPGAARQQVPAYVSSMGACWYDCSGFELTKGQGVEYPCEIGCCSKDAANDSTFKANSIVLVCITQGVHKKKGVLTFFLALQNTEPTQCTCM
jgi:hypothetical protein